MRLGFNLSTGYSKFINKLELITLIYYRLSVGFNWLLPPLLIIKVNVHVMIHCILIIIYEDHINDQESLVIHNNTIFLYLIIDVEPMYIIVCVVSGVCTISPPLPLLVMVTWISIIWVKIYSVTSDITSLVT